MSQYELNKSVIAAIDAFHQVQCLQELLEMAIDQATESAQKRQQRTELLTMCYLYQVKPYLEQLQLELKEIQQQLGAYVGQMNGTHGVGLAAERV